MMRPVNVLLSFCVPFFVFGCASVNSISLTSIPSQRQNVVRAQVEKLIILGFNFDNDFIDPLVDQLKSQCPNGLVSGLLTKDETISYFLAHKRIVTAEGFCQKAVTASATEKKAVKQ